MTGLPWLHVAWIPNFWREHLTFRCSTWCMRDPLTSWGVLKIHDFPLLSWTLNYQTWEYSYFHLDHFSKVLLWCLIGACGHGEGLTGEGHPIHGRTSEKMCILLCIFKLGIIRVQWYSVSIYMYLLHISSCNSLHTYSFYTFKHTYIHTKKGTNKQRNKQTKKLNMEVQALSTVCLLFMYL